jgi:putative intracellular protease/amidase
MKKIFFVVAALLLLNACKNKVQNTEPAKTHGDVMKELGAPKVTIKTVGILLYNGFNTLDAIGPYQVLSELMGTKVFFIAKQKGMIKNTKDLAIEVKYSFTDIDSLDILIIPGGLTETFLLTKDTTTLNWIKKIDKKTKYTASVCTGAWILGATGLLQGKKATTHWYRAPEMLSKYGATFVQQRYINDGKYWSSAGVTAGMDMSLALIKDIRGENYLKLAMLDLEYDPAPPIKAGSILNTDTASVNMMRDMYDFSMKPLLDSALKNK